MTGRLSVLVVTYGCADTVGTFHRQLADSLAKMPGHEILYHDNSPDDSVVTTLEQAGADIGSISRDRDNPGFAAGVNRLLARADGQYIALVNPDVSGFTPRFWQQLMNTARPGEARFVRLNDSAGNMQDCVGRAPSLRRALLPRRRWARISRPTSVETGIMAFMFTHRQNLERVGPLDESYWLYAEDLDWCWRARQKGIRLVYDPRLSLVHSGGQSADTIMSRREQKIAKYRAEGLFIDRHYRGLHRWIMGLLNRYKIFRCQ